MQKQEVLAIRGLKTWFDTRRGVVRAVDGVDLTLHRGEVLGVVGESGCGKSMTALSVLRLVQSPPGRIVAGEILYEGRNLLELGEREMNAVRGRDISMIFQEPMTSLNPVYTVGNQIGEVLTLHMGMDRQAARERGIELLELVHIPSPEKRIDCYPHELSGGMRQRVMIAMALACDPSVLIADEPTTALDVTIQAQILDLMLELRDRTGTGILFITHDLGVVAELCDRMAVMYCGRVVEQGPVREVFQGPRHPYTRGLLRSIPGIDEDVAQLHSIRGTVPSPFELPAGCAFAPRCDQCGEPCQSEMPPLRELDGGRRVRCHRQGVAV